ncbi:hypothetical protein ACLOJK_034373, partial [Asimina triloba]
HLPPDEQAATARVDATELLLTTPTGSSVWYCLDPALSPVVIAIGRRHGRPVPLPATLPTLVPLLAATFPITGLANKPPSTARPPLHISPTRCQQRLPSMPDADVCSTLTCRHGRGTSPSTHSDNRCRMRIIRSRCSYSASTTAYYSTPIIAYKRMQL